MVFILLLLSACRPSEEAPSSTTLLLSLVNPALVWQDEVLGVRTSLAFRPTPAILEALEHGVPVTVVVETRVHPTAGFLASNDQTRNHRYEIRYLPLSEHYQLTALKTNQSTTFPRLRLLLADLSEPRLLDTQLRADALDGQSWQVQVRVDIDRARLPAPMQVGVWRDRQWSSNDAWQTFVVNKPVDGEAE